MRLGHESVSTLLAFVRHEVAQRDTRLPAPGANEDFLYGNDPLTGALDLLTDIGDRSCVPELVQTLEFTRRPSSRKLLAESLIRLGDVRAVPALFHYACSASDGLAHRNGLGVQDVEVRGQRLLRGGLDHQAPDDRLQGM